MNWLDIFATAVGLYVCIDGIMHGPLSRLMGRLWIRGGLWRHWE